MAKDKATGTKGPTNKHLSARISYLQQAALYLAEAQSKPMTQATFEPSAAPPYHVKNNDTQASVSPTQDDSTARDRLPGGMTTHLALQLRQVALKSQIRLRPATKHFSCKVCHTVLLEGSTCRKYVENLSSGGRKLHADVTVHECRTCGVKKRFPLNATRQLRKNNRTMTAEAQPQVEKTPDLSPG